MITEKLNYQDYLKSDYWKNKRIETLRKQGKKCRVCGSDKNINIHHRRYKHNGESILGKEINQLLLPLCNDCHFLWHELHGFRRIPFVRLRMILSLGVPKLKAFTHPYISIRKLRKSLITN